jgi:hypothetical protein
MVESSAFQDVVRKSVANNEVRVFAGAGNPSLDLLPLCEWLCEYLSRLCENLSRLCEGENDRIEMANTLNYGLILSPLKTKFICKGITKYLILKYF